jgi:hypothetical protein
MMAVGKLMLKALTPDRPRGQSPVGSTRRRSTVIFETETIDRHRRMNACDLVVGLAFLSDNDFYDITIGFM